MKTTPPPRARSAASLASSSSNASMTSLVDTGSAGTLKCTKTSEPMSSRMSHTTDISRSGFVSRNTAASSMSSGRIPRITCRPSKAERPG